MVIRRRVTEGGGIIIDTNSEVEPDVVEEKPHPAAFLVWLLSMTGWGPLPESVTLIRLQFAWILGNTARDAVRDDSALGWLAEATDEEIRGLFGIAEANIDNSEVEPDGNTA